MIYYFNFHAVPVQDQVQFIPFLCLSNAIFMNAARRKTLMECGILNSDDR